MNYFFDTSALIKKYILETGSEVVDTLMINADIIYVSSITKIECISTIKRILGDKLISLKDYKSIKRELALDFNYIFQPHLTVRRKG